MITLPAFLRPVSSVRPLVCLAAAAGLMMFATCAVAQVRYSNPDEAVTALITAAKAPMRDWPACSGRAAARSCPPAIRSPMRRRASASSRATRPGTRWMEGADKAVLIIGQEEWPFPIPLVRKDGAWSFDTAAGREEILFRRIGRNELSAIQTCLAYVDAQQEYAERGIAGSGAYAQRVISRPGGRTGSTGRRRPARTRALGESVAAATAEGYRAGERPIPYHGYYYKILTRQGPSAPGGTLSYVVRGKMIGGSRWSPIRPNTATPA